LRLKIGGYWSASGSEAVWLVVLIVVLGPARLYCFGFSPAGALSYFDLATCTVY